MEPDERRGTEEREAGGTLVALTGATGFIGQYLLKELPQRGYRLRVLFSLPDHAAFRLRQRRRRRSRQALQHV